MDSLTGRTAFITGGGNGIGLATATSLARRGVSVAVADIDEEAVVRAAEQLSRISAARGFVLDVRDRQGFARVADEVERTLGTVSILVNNAGILDSVSPSRMDHTMWDHVMGINAGGVYNGLQSFMPQLIRSRDGHIVNTASAAGLFVDGSSPLYMSGFLYHASKFAVVGMSESLRVELAPRGIGVSVLCPGPVATDIVQNARLHHPAEADRHSPRISAVLDSAHTSLRDRGIAPAVVGEMVVDAILRDRPYILTTAEMGPGLQRRGEALLDALPAD